MFYAGWNYGVRMELVGIYKSDPEVHVRQSVPPTEYIEHILEAKFCPVRSSYLSREPPSALGAWPARAAACRETAELLVARRLVPQVCGGFSQWTPRLAEALYYECVPIILSPMMLPPWSKVLDWSKFSVRMDPSRQNLLGLKAHLKTLDHAAMLRGVRAAKHALTYRLDSYVGDDMLPLLLWEMHKVARVPVPPYPGLTVRQLANDIVTDKDYDVGLKNVQSQRAHDVRASASVSLTSSSDGTTEVWDCTTKDGYMCGCRKQKKGKGKGGKGAGKGGAMRGKGHGRGLRAMGHGRVLRAKGKGKGKGGGFYSTKGLLATSGGGGGEAILGDKFVESLPCPSGGNLEDPAQLDAMLAARANSEKDVVITILGPTSGTRAVVMDQVMGEAFVLNLLKTLNSFGVTNTLPITTHLHQPDHPQNNLCLSRLRPRGVCCAYSGVGMDLVHAGAPGQSQWAVSETHPCAHRRQPTTPLPHALCTPPSPPPGVSSLPSPLPSPPRVMTCACPTHRPGTCSSCSDGGSLDRPSGAATTSSPSTPTCTSPPIRSRCSSGQRTALSVPSCSSTPAGQYRVMPRGRLRRTSAANM